MIKEIRRFTDAGNSEYIRLLSEKPSDLGIRLEALADDPAFSIGTENIATAFAIPTTRFDVGSALYPIIGSGGPLSPYSRDAFMWNWISAKLFRLLVTDSKGLEKMGQIDKWALSQSTRRYYRHYLAGAYFAYEAHVHDLDAAMCILFQPIKGGGEIVEQIQGTDEIAYSVCCTVATKLYYSPKENKLRAGASSKSPGSVRRLVVVLNQLLVTTDIKGMNVDDVIDLLPNEFGKFTKPSDIQSKSEISTFESDDEIDDDGLVAQVSF